MKYIGPFMNIHQALNAVDFEDAYPVFEYKGYYYCLDASGKDLGSVYYTKVDRDMTTMIHSVKMPYSKARTVGETIDRGEGLSEKHPPIIDILPVETFSVFPPQQKCSITKFV